MKGLKMKVEKIAEYETINKSCNLGHCHEEKEISNYSLLTYNECNENYSSQELHLYAQWLEDLYKSDFLGPRSRITEIVLNRILNATLNKYNITKKF